MIRLREPPHAGGVEHSTNPLVEVPAIDGFRGLAAVLIVTYHSWVIAFAPQVGGAATTALSVGYLAMPFFFVISGFVLFLPTCRRDGEFGNRAAYAVRRVARIVPAYYVALAATVLLWPLVMTKWLPGVTWPLGSWGGIGVLVAHLTFLHQEIIRTSVVAGFPGVGFAYDSVIWSLSLEAVFYVLLPFIAFRFWRRPLVWLALAWLLELGWRAGVVHSSQSVLTKLGLFDQFPGYAGQFALGMAGALVYVRAMRAERGIFAALRRRAPFLVLLGVAILFFGSWWAGRAVYGGPFVHPYGLTPHDELPVLGFATLMLGTALAGGRWALPFTNPVARWLGVVSYGMFLWHLIVLKAIAAAFFPTLVHPDRTIFAIVLVVALASATLLGAGSYFLIERPAMRLARRGLVGPVSRRAALGPAP